MVQIDTGEWLCNHRVKEILYRYHLSELVLHSPSPSEMTNLPTQSEQTASSRRFVG